MHTDDRYVGDQVATGRRARGDAPSQVIDSPSGTANLGTILGIWAHPDDEAYLSAGLMAIARAAGSRVVCVTATRGELGSPDPQAWPPPRLAAERAGELTRCLEILGVSEHHWLGYRDGECAAVPPPEAVARLCDLIRRVGPDTVVTFGSDGITGHSDHQVVSTWATAAFDRAAGPGARLLYAAIAQPRVSRWQALDDSLGVYLPGYPIPVPVDGLAVDLVLDEDTAARKVRALAAQATQTAGLIASMGVDRYTQWVNEESFTERSRGPAVAAERLAVGVTRVSEVPLDE